MKTFITIFILITGQLTLAQVSTRKCPNGLEIKIEGSSAKDIYDSMTSVTETKGPSGKTTKSGGSAHCEKDQSNYSCISIQDEFGIFYGGDLCE